MREIVNDNEVVLLTHFGPSYQDGMFPDIKAKVVRETATQITLSHPRLGVLPAKFSRTNGFRSGTQSTLGLGRTGYMLPSDELKRSR